jgi:hypothetical protein
MVMKEEVAMKGARPAVILGVAGNRVVKHCGDFPLVSTASSLRSLVPPPDLGIKTRAEIMRSFHRYRQDTLSWRRRLCVAFSRLENNAKSNSMQTSSRMQLALAHPILCRHLTSTSLPQLRPHDSIRSPHFHSTAPMIFRPSVFHHHPLPFGLILPITAIRTILKTIETCMIVESRIFPPPLFAPVQQDFPPSLFPIRQPLSPRIPCPIHRKALHFRC